MIPVSFEEAAERSRRRRVCELEIALIRERSRDVFADGFVVLRNDPEWRRVLALVPEWDPYGWRLVIVVRHAPGAWTVKPNGYDIGISIDETDLFARWGLL